MKECKMESKKGELSFRVVGIEKEVQNLNLTTCFGMLYRKQLCPNNKNDTYTCCLSTLAR